MAEYEDLISAADKDRERGFFKEAHIQYGTALAAGGVRDYYCRHMRGLCARRVSEQRLQKAVDQPERRQLFLNQAANWLAKSEANLDSAMEHAPEAQRGHIRLDQARTEEAMGRFMVMSGGDPGRRLSAARRYREEGLELLS